MSTANLSSEITIYDFRELPGDFDLAFSAELLLQSLESFNGEVENSTVLREPGIVRQVGDGPARRKSLALAILAGRTALKLCETRSTFPVGDQLLRASASIGANVEEANGAYSPREFAFKMAIALREARETRYWARYAFGLNLIDESTKTQIHDAADELVRLLAKIVSTTKERYAIKPKQPKRS